MDNDHLFLGKWEKPKPVFQQILFQDQSISEQSYPIQLHDQKNGSGQYHLSIANYKWLTTELYSSFFFTLIALLNA